MAGNSVLSYHNSRLSSADVRLLREGSWLNDNLIAFWFEYLEHTVLEECKDVALVTPDATQLVKFMTVEEIGMALADLSLSSKEMVIFALNDNESVAEAGGSHWSLLCYRRHNNAFYHFDSLNDSNHATARDVESKITPVLGCTSPPQRIHTQCRCQANSSDCGVYVLLYSEYLVRQFVKTRLACFSIPDVLDFPSPADAKAKRRAVHQCIVDLRSQS